MYFCTICNIDYIYVTKDGIRSYEPLLNKNSKGHRYCKLCDMEVKDYYKHTFSVLHSIKRHIHEFYKPLPDPNNKGNKLCKLCDIKVNNYYKHTFSALHRFNQDVASLVFYHDVNEFINHFNQLKEQKEIEDILKHNEENIFWITSGEELDDEQYNQLKGEIIGKPRKTSIRRKRANS